MLQKSILLSELKHSPTNVRKVKGSDSGFKSLCASIKAKGLLHNLVVVKNGKGYNVIDGNRRLDALNAIYENSDDIKLVSCIVVDREDDELGLHANMMREDMHPLDECDAINALVADGSEDFDSVAGRFGQTKRWVEQRVGLSDLSDTAKEMFRQNKFGIGVATALTLGSVDKQNKFLEENKDHNLTANWVKSAMTGGKVALSNALFPTDSDSLLAMPDLDIESDLFSEDVFITNLDAFIKYQDMELQKIVQTHRDEGYMDVVLLKDEYWFDSPAVRGFTLVRDEKFDTGDMIMVISYNTYNYRIDKMQMITREMDEQEQANLEQQEAEEQEIEVTPMLMTKPQENLLNGYYGTYAKAVMYEKLHENPHNLEKLSKSLIVHRRLGYTYSGINRIGNVFADYQKQYPVDEEPHGYTTPEHEEFIEHHINLCRNAYEDDGVAPLHYCLNLPDEELDKLFVSIVITSLSKHDMQNEVLKEAGYDYTDHKGWFTPDTTWLNKYKAEQISQLEDYVFGKVKSGTKKSRVDALQKELQTNPVFNPFGDWPQFKE